MCCMVASKRSSDTSRQSTARTNPAPLQGSHSVAGARKGCKRRLPRGKRCVRRRPQLLSPLAQKAARRPAGRVIRAKKRRLKLLIVTALREILRGHFRLDELLRLRQKN